MTTSAADVASPAARGRLTPRRLMVIAGALLAALGVVVVIALAVGSERIPIPTVAKILASTVTGQTLDAEPELRTIVLSVRLPRVLTAIVVGAALSVAGAAYQSLLRNPLADPYILGVSTGAALGAIVATVFSESLAISRPLAAFAGAIITTAVVYAVGHGGSGGGSTRLILAGVITNTFLSSTVIFFLTAAPELQVRSVFSWLIGDLSGEPGLLPAVTGLFLLGSAVIYACARSLNLMMVGEEDAIALGVPVERVKVSVYLAASLITGAAVAMGGVIGFIGLIVPHAIRLPGGSDNRLVIPGSALAGACFLLVADTIARTIIAPRELHVGVITALVGAPAFVYLLRRSR